MRPAQIARHSAIADPAPPIAPNRRHHPAHRGLSGIATRPNGVVRMSERLRYNPVLDPQWRAMAENLLEESRRRRQRFLQITDSMRASEQDALEEDYLQTMREEESELWPSV